MLAPMPRAILLDAGGVLVMPDLDEVSSALARVGVAAAHPALDRAHYLGMAAWDALGATAPEAGWQAYVTAVARAAGCPEDDLEAATSALREAFGTSAIWRRPRPDSLAALPGLLATGFRLAVVSNSDGTVERLLRDIGACQVGPGPGTEVLGVLDSHVVGSAKPDPGIFERALACVGATPDEAVHVGDSAWADVGGARAVGIRALHFDPYGVCADRSHDHLAALADLLAATSAP
ncbi:MAG TPA: HAD family hydrolase [Candidatus Limnocylindrales bacterium]